MWPNQEMVGPTAKLGRRPLCKHMTAVELPNKISLVKKMYFL